MMNKKKKDNRNSKVFLRWATSAIILFIVIVMLVTNFSIESRTTAIDNVKNDLATESLNYALVINDILNNVEYAGRGAASVITQNGIDSQQFGEYAQKINNSVSGVYLTIVTMGDGKGVDSFGNNVDVSEFTYFNNQSLSKYAYVSDNGVTGESAYVCSIPLTLEGQVYGTIYLFISPDKITNILPVKSYGGGVGFTVYASDGTIISSMGSSGFFNSGDNFFINLSKAEMNDLSLAQIKLRTEKNTNMVFYASKGDEYKAIAVAPIGIMDWQLAIIMNSRYVNTIVNSELQDAKRLIVSLSVVLCIFVAILIVSGIVSKLRFGEESKDLADKADTDLLTGLNNKIATERKIQEYMDENPDSQCMMFLFDIDNFKKINDTMGHAFGDEVLRSLGHQLCNEFRVTDIIGRLGGDEFVLFLKNIKSDEQLEKEGIRITRFFHQFKAGDYVKYSATASIGAVVFPRDAKDFQSAYKAADKALYEAKRRGKNQLVFYDSNLESVNSIRVTDDIDPITK